MLDVVRAYTKKKSSNPLAKYLPALREVNGSDSHDGLGKKFVKAWKKAAKDSKFQQAQDKERDNTYFNPSVKLAKSDGLNALGQFCYYDAAVVHGFEGMQGIRKRALAVTPTPAAGGNEFFFINAFLNERNVEMKKEEAHSDLSRIDKAQRRFLFEGNFDLHLPLEWSVYGDPYKITQ